MDDRLRGRRLLLSLAVVFPCVAFACARDAAPIVGTSSTGGSTATPIDAGTAPVPPAIPRDFRATFAKANRARFASRGHLEDRFAADVYLSAPAASAYKSELATFLPGAMLVMEHFERTVAGDRPAGILAMEKRDTGFDPENGDWRWIVVSAKGDVVKEGKIEKCAACHRESRHDFVFRVVE